MVQFDMTSFTKCLTSLRMESVTLQRDIWFRSAGLANTCGKFLHQMQVVFLWNDTTTNTCAVLTCELKLLLCKAYIRFELFRLVERLQLSHYCPAYRGSKLRPQFLE